MPLSASAIIARANQIAKTPGYVTQANDFLNAILSDLCETYDLAVARGVFNFNFNPSMVTTYGSGPYPMPLDYLRTSGSSGSDGAGFSAFWTLLGVPYPMIPCDLSDFDMQVQQAGLNSYPWLWATDMSQRTIVNSTYGNTYSNTTLDTLGSTAGVAVGMTASGPGIPPLTTVTGLGPTTAVLSQPATATAVASPIAFGYPAVGYAYPPPSGGFPVTIRYQRSMPQIVNANLSNVAPWFPNSRYLIQQLAGMMMEISDDARAATYLGEGEGIGAAAILRHYLQMKDDDTNRAKTVQLDRRTFGSRFSRLKNTKTVGW